MENAKQVVRRREIPVGPSDISDRYALDRCAVMLHTFVRGRKFTGRYFAGQGPSRNIDGWYR